MPSSAHRALSREFVVIKRSTSFSVRPGRYPVGTSGGVDVPCQVSRRPVAHVTPSTNLCISVAPSSSLSIVPRKLYSD